MITKRSKGFAVRIISIITVLSIIFSVSISASAENVTLSFEEYVKIPNEYGSTNIGGIALNRDESTGNREMYVIKANSDENKAVLYYYPKVLDKDNYIIIKLDDIAGHCNSMTIGSSNIFITCWQKKDNGEKNNLLRISRSRIRNIYSDTSVGSIASTVLNKNSNGVTIIEVYEGTTEENISYATSKYSTRIAAITKYGTTIDNYNDGRYFIVGKSQNSTKKTFAKAKLRTNSKGNPELVVLTEETFTTEDPYNSLTGQDFHYYPGKGFFVSYWAHKTANNTNSNKGTIKYGTENKILHYRFDHDTLFDSSHLNIRNTYTIQGNSNKFLKFEIESLTFKGDHLIITVNAKKWSSTNTATTVEQKAEKDKLDGSSDDKVIQTQEF